MYPDLSYLFHDLFGTSYDNGFSTVKMYGLMLSLAFISAYIVLRSELKRHARLKNFTPIDKNSKQKESNPWINRVFGLAYAFLFGYKLGYIILNTTEFFTDTSAVLFSGKGNIITGLLFIAAALLAEKYIGNKKTEEIKTDLYPHDLVMMITLIAGISGIIGAKIFSIIENLPGFFADPIGTFFSGSGLTIYGGIIGGFIACTIYLKQKNIPLLRIYDCASPALLVGYAVGRLGCQLSGDGDWGKVNSTAIPDWFIFPDWLWAYDYPHNISNKGIAMADCAAKYCQELSPPVFPTPLYEIIIITFFLFIIWSFRKKIKTPGVIFSIYLIMNGIERFFIEFVRVNKHYDALGFSLSQAQLIALGLITAGLILFTYLWQQQEVR